MTELTTSASPNPVAAAAPKVISFGCRLNTYESSVMQSLAEQAKLPNAIIINTCAVTAEAERQARQTIRKTRREHPNAIIVATGCAVQIDPARYAAMPEIDRIIGNSEKFNVANFAPQADRVIHSDIMAVRETAPHLASGFHTAARGFIEIQQGCDHRCTFCIIPFGRGNSRSVPIGEIVRRIQSLVAAGVSEVVLTGVDIASFGGDLPGRPSLGGLVIRLLKLVPELRRLRLSSIDPAVIDPLLWRAIAEEERLMPHLHLSLQSGADLILKRMKRRHSRAAAIVVIEQARRLRSGIAIGADLIAGFPTESDAAFADSLSLVKDHGISHLHVFPYSPREGTPAARMPNLPTALIRARAKLLRAAGADELARYETGQLGETRELVMETSTMGRSENYLNVALEDNGLTPIAGALLPVVITGRGEKYLTGTPLASLPQKVV